MLKIKPNFIPILIFIIVIISIFVGLLGISYIIHAPITFIIAFLFTMVLSYKYNLYPNKNRINLKLFMYIGWLLKEIFYSSIYVIKNAWSRKINLNPHIGFIKLKSKDIHKHYIYANSITLTPGTVTIYITSKYLLVHAIDKKLFDDLQEGYMESKVNRLIS